MSIVIRYVHIDKEHDAQEEYVEIKESFLEFINIADSTGANMGAEILNALNKIVFPLIIFAAKDTIMERT